MTSEQMRYAASVMLAAADGAKVEFQGPGGQWNESNGSFDWYHFDYRIKKQDREPKTLGQIACENFGSDLRWEMQISENKARWNRAAEAVAKAVKEGSL